MILLWRRVCCAGRTSRISSADTNGSEQYQHRRPTWLGAHARPRCRAGSIVPGAAGGVDRQAVLLGGDAVWLARLPVGVAPGQAVIPSPDALLRRIGAAQPVPLAAGAQPQPRLPKQLGRRAAAGRGKRHALLLAAGLGDGPGGRLSDGQVYPAAHVERRVCRRSGTFGLERGEQCTVEQLQVLHGLDG